jgi:hypothetical protein
MKNERSSRIRRLWVAIPESVRVDEMLYNISIKKISEYFIKNSLAEYFSAA